MNNLKSEFIFPNQKGAIATAREVKAGVKIISQSIGSFKSTKEQSDKAIRVMSV